MQSSQTLTMVPERVLSTFTTTLNSSIKMFSSPALKEHGVETVIHMGDAFDSRKSIDYQSLEWSKRVVFDNLKDYDVHMIIGNHDTYYKNTNEVNSPELLLQTYSNIKTYSHPTEVKIGGLNILFLPWINQGNEEASYQLIKETNCKCAMGHLEFQGFRVNRQIIMEHGLSKAELFEKFEYVFSGHYHTRSNDGRIFTWAIPMKCSGLTLTIPEDFIYLIRKTLL